MHRLLLLLYLKHERKKNQFCLGMALSVYNIPFRVRPEVVHSLKHSPISFHQLEETSPASAVKNGSISLVANGVKREDGGEKRSGEASPWIRVI